MKKILWVFAVMVLSLGYATGQNVPDFKIVDITRGNETVHENKYVKIPTFKKEVMLAVYDFNGDGILDTIYYRLGTKSNTITATVVWYDVKKDDWITLYSMNIQGLAGTDGVYFFTTNLDATPAPEFVVYTVKKDYKSATIIRYKSDLKGFMSTEYVLNPKNYYPHKLVVNKRLFHNAKGSDEQTFDEMPLKDTDK